MPNFDIFNIMFIVVPIIVVLGVIFTFIMMFSPKLRGNFLGKQVKAMKYMTEKNKEDLTDIATNLSEVSINSSKNIIDRNEDKLRDINTRNAEINSKGVEIYARSIKKGLSEEEKKYCSKCGKLIDKEANYCEKCGEKQ